VLHQGSPISSPTEGCNADARPARSRTGLDAVTPYPACAADPTPAARAVAAERARSSPSPRSPGAFDTTFNGGGDAFVTKLNAAGTALVYSTFLGGSANDAGFGIAVDAAGRAYVTGSTFSPDFPTTPGAPGTTFSGGQLDAFVTSLNAAGTALAYSTFLGGSGNDQGIGIAVDAASNAYVTGFTSSADFPTIPGAFDTTFNGGDDAFVTKLTQNPTTKQQCKHGGFQQFGFKNQGQCIRFVQTGKDSRIGE